jgi:hypothetical protein
MATLQAAEAVRGLVHLALVFSEDDYRLVLRHVQRDVAAVVDHSARSVDLVGVTDQLEQAIRTVETGKELRSVFFAGFR